MHIKNQIRDAVAVAMGGTLTAGANVFKSHIYPLSENQLPAICVYSLSESIQYTTTGKPRRQERTITIGVECYVRAISGYDVSLDLIQSEVEKAIYALSISGVYFINIDSVNTSLSNEGEKPLARTSLEVSFVCGTLENDPDNFA